MNKKNKTEVLGIILVLLFGLSQFFSGLANNDYQNIITEFDKKNEILFDFVYDYSYSEWYKLMAIKEAVINKNIDMANLSYNMGQIDQSEWRERRDELEIITGKIKEYSNKVTILTWASNICFVLGLLVIALIFSHDLKKDRATSELT
ncbi:hypothetical protein CMO89_03895 [Candidatus Woesearchaeota archaeon]|nr:hypothetical protein [Candidatus Woesearchaeota archaeon]|tara:strand:+ start:3466 stop:3909 length:444 start_codon:yes stop_codon:yes gene_type:complete